MKRLIAFAQERDIRYKVQEPMAGYTTMKVGGPAELVLFPRTQAEVADIVRRCRGWGIRLTVLGNGSNVLISDQGLRGAVLLLGRDFAAIRYLGDGVLCAQAGASLNRLCRAALEHGLTGLEFAFGIPGSVGGAAFMNAGAYGGEMKDVLLRCRHVTPEGELAVCEAGDMDLSYRHSAYADNGCVITEVLVQLQKGDKAAIKAKMEELMERRKTKQPLEYPSAGSTFKRPEGFFAGTLIEACGLKGKTIGGAQVSEKHAGFLINVGGASCQDILDLAAFVQAAVQAQKGVALEMEIRVLQ